MTTGMTAQQEEPGAFVFRGYDFAHATGELSLRYGYEGGAEFTETLHFPMPDGGMPKEREGALKAAFDFLFFLCGVSYYKAFVPNEIIFEGPKPDAKTAKFLQDVYTLGLAEFAYENDIDIREKVSITGAGHAPKVPSLNLTDHALVPVGGGKDSIVSIEALRNAGHNLTLFALGGAAGPAQPIAETIKASGLKSLYVSRTLSPELLRLNKEGAYNGHIPITAIVSAAAVATAILHGLNAVILSNEASASAPNIQQGDWDINHQWSKSLEFESAFAEHVRDSIAPTLDYFSLLRPLSEAAITQRFAKLYEYHPVFRSCNTAFKQDKDKRGTHWCCDCPKCRFVFLALAPFASKEKMIAIFGRNMLDDEPQLHGFKQLCGLIDFKPFECVGEVEESALLMEALTLLDDWKDALIVKECAVSRPDFDARLAALLEPSEEHLIPARFAGVIS